MIKYVFLTLLVLVFSCETSTITVSSNSLNKEGNVYKSKGNPFTGKVMDTTELGRVIKAFNCENGKIVGDYVEYHKNGNIALKYSYKNGVREGEAVHFNDNGSKAKIETFKGGQKTGKYKDFYYKSSKVLKEGTYKNWKKDGIWKEYYKNGKLKSEGKYEGGLMQGEWKFYFENGKLNGIGSYKDGDGTNYGNSGVPRNGRVDSWRFYKNESGILRETQVYRPDGSFFFKLYSTSGSGVVVKEGSGNAIGYITGKVNYYDEKGILIRTENF